MTDFQKIFYNREQYSKRLLGNSFSLPVIEHLLKPLCSIFASRDYPIYEYQFPWPPYNYTNSTVSVNEIESSDDELFDNESDDSSSSWERAEV